VAAADKFGRKKTSPTAVAVKKIVFNRFMARVLVIRPAGRNSEYQVEESQTEASEPPTLPAQPEDLTMHRAVALVALPLMLLELVEDPLAV